MSKRILIESSLEKKIHVQNFNIEQVNSSITGINYFDDDANAYSYEKYSDDANFDATFNDDELISFLEDIRNESILNIELDFRHKTVHKTVIYSNGSERKQLIYYNEANMIINTNKDVNKRYHTCFGYTNIPISKIQLYEQYDNLTKQINNNESYFDFSNAPYPIILNPEVSGVFIHEIIGHLCEFDNRNDPSNLFKDLEIDEFTIVDDPTFPNLWGSYDFDDEGVTGTKTLLIENGIFKDYLLDNFSARTMNKLSNGHARSIDYRYRPIIRMSNTILVNGSSSFSEMLDSIQYGMLALTTTGGMLKRNVFKLNVSNGIMIIGGKLTKKTGPFSVWGKVDDIGLQIQAIGNEGYTSSGQGCYKNGQGPLPVSVTAPHIMLKKALITKVEM